jgi:predicted DNA-binding transcriptional regulator AlpA
MSTKKTAHPQLVKPSVVAALIGCTRRTLDTWARDVTSLFPKPIVVAPKTIRYDLAEVQAFLRAQRWTERMLGAGERSCAK